MDTAIRLAHWLLVAFAAFGLGYFVAINLLYTALLAIGWTQIGDYVRRRALRDYDIVGRSELSLPVSILVPAYNEQPVIVETVRSLLATRYRQFELVVVNDGSTDETLRELAHAFKLVEVERVPRARLATARVKAVYKSSLDDRLVVIDKDNGGKADALNCGLAHARYPLFCAVDSDTLLEEDALQRLVWQFQAEPDTVACGGIVRIINGSTISSAKVTRIETPRGLLVNVQILEYLRAFLASRTGWSRLGMLLIISGAFGLFRREAAIEAGGYSTTTVGEDAELVVRLHRRCREQRRSYKVAFIADPVCWTEAPQSFRQLGRQRDRWQRGLIETLWRHRCMIGRRRYGRIGLVAMPLFVVFEMLGPLIELSGFVAVAAGLLLGWVAPATALVFFGLATCYGVVLSLGALRLEERAFQRYRRWTCLGRLLAASLVENFGYRQTLAIIRCHAFWSKLRRSRHWGEMARVGYSVQPETVEEAPAPAPA